MDETPISNSLPCSTTKDLKAIENTPPSERGAAAKFSVEDVTKRKVLCLEDAGPRVLGLEKILHACFASRARLKAYKFLKPMPPCDFGLHIVFHPTHAILGS